MTQRIVRLSIVGLAAALMLAAMTGCFFGGGEEEPEPTEAPDLAATIAAAVGDAVPTETPVPPTDTPEPPAPEPTPDLAATLAAMMAATQAAQPTDTPAPQPTDTPVPAPTATATPLPTDTPVPPTETPLPPTPTVPPRQAFDGPPCIVAGKVTIGGATPPAGTPVFAVSQSADGTVVAEDQTDTQGRYQLQIEYSGEAFNIYVRASDSGVDTTACTSKGAREIKNLDVP